MDIMVKPALCPYCSKILDAAQGDAPPIAGDFTLCYHCLATLRFDGEITPQKLSDEDMTYLRDNPILAIQLLKFVNMFKAVRN